MPPLYTISASVVDINNATPKNTDTFLVDTNIWFWMTYPTANQSANFYQTNDYPNFLNTALNNGSKIFRSNISFAELSHIIEVTEHEIYAQFVKKITPKEYRHNITSERGRITNNIDTCWKQVEALAEPLNLEIDDNIISSALSLQKNVKIDGYDLFILETMIKHGVIKLITDDGDFSTVPGIEVYTANRSVVKAAKAQGKFVTR